MSAADDGVSGIWAPVHDESCCSGQSVPEANEDALCLQTWRSLSAATSVPLSQQVNTRRLYIWGTVHYTKSLLYTIASNVVMWIWNFGSGVESVCVRLKDAEISQCYCMYICMCFYLLLPIARSCSTCTGTSLRNWARPSFSLHRFNSISSSRFSRECFPISHCTIRFLTEIDRRMCR